MYMGIQSESIQPAPKIAHLRNLYEASVTAALFMITSWARPRFAAPCDLMERMLF